MSSGAFAGASRPLHVARMRDGATVAELNLRRICGMFSDRGPAPPPPRQITEIRRIVVEPDGREWEY